MADATPLAGIGALGRCYDVTFIDPLDLDQSGKYKNALKVVADKVVMTRDGGFGVPGYCDFKTLYAQTSLTQKSTITCGGDYIDEMGGSVNVQGEVPVLASFSGSASYKQLLQDSASSERAYVYSQVLQRNFGLSVDFLSKSLELDDEFVAAVNNLPVDANDPDVITKYYSLIEEFGTHFSSTIELGGRAFQRVSSSIIKEGSTKTTEAEIKADASIEIDALKAGMSADAAKKSSSTVDSKKQYERDELIILGGQSSTKELDASWISTLADKPALIMVGLTPLTVLMTEALFPGCEDIGARRVLLEIAVKRWIGEKRSDVDRVLRYGDTVAVSIEGTGGAEIALVIEPMATAQGFAYLRCPPPGSNLEPFLAVVQPFGQASDTSLRTGEPILYGDELQLFLSDGKTLLISNGPDGGQKDTRPFLHERDPSVETTSAKFLYRDNRGSVLSPAGRMVKQGERVVISMNSAWWSGSGHPITYGFGELTQDGYLLMTKKDDGKAFVRLWCLNR